MVVLVAGGGFVVFQAPARHLEARAAAGVLRLAGNRSVFMSSASAIQVVPGSHAPFRAIVTPTCSSLASALAIGCLASLAVRRPRARRLFATTAAIGTVVAGNILRIASSVAIGLLAGRPSLILFHDWVGSVFGFAYTLGGYVLLLVLLLPSHRPSIPEPFTCRP
jgi:exosortase/archaeosortase family protein